MSAFVNENRHGHAIAAKLLLNISHPVAAIGQTRQAEDRVQHVAGMCKAVVRHLLVIP